MSSTLLEPEIVESIQGLRTVAPWIDDYYRLWSVFEMLEHNARGFWGIATHVAFARSAITQMSKEAGRGAALAPHHKDYGTLMQTLASFEESAQSLGLTVSLLSIARAKAALQGGIRLDVLMNHLDFAAQCVQDELESKVFLYLQPDKITFYKDGPEVHFGASVCLMWPDVKDDLSEASRCMSLNRSTACVFHLMRVIEFVIKDWASKFPTATLTRLTRRGVFQELSWSDLEGELQSQIANMPITTQAEKDARDARSRMVALFGNIRHGWRNGTMHPAAKYTEEEARDVFSSVRTFLSALEPLV